MSRPKKIEETQTNSETSISRTIARYITAFIFLILAVVILLGVFHKGGIVGDFLSKHSITFIGYFGALWLSYLFFLISFALFQKKSLIPPVLPTLGHLFLLPSTLALFQGIGLSAENSGMLGFYSQSLLQSGFVAREVQFFLHNILR